MGLAAESFRGRFGNPEVAVSPRARSVPARGLLNGGRELALKQFCGCGRKRLCRFVPLVVESLESLNQHVGPTRPQNSISMLENAKQKKLHREMHRFSSCSYNSGAIGGSRSQRSPRQCSGFKFYPLAERSVGPVPFPPLVQGSDSL
jgi:hypothetical protein